LLHDGLVGDLIKISNGNQQGIVFKAVIKNIELLPLDMRPKLGPELKVIVKQYNFASHKQCYLQEVDFLGKVLRLDMPANGGFPVMLSHKQTLSKGEIVMNYIGSDLETVFFGVTTEISKTKGKVTWSKLFKLSIDMLSQLQVMGKLGYVHRDLKMQNICFDA
jgi:hypothetical protein